MKLQIHLYTIITIFLCSAYLTKGQHLSDCSRAEYNRCINLADPLLKEAHLIFPDNMADIELVCLTWNQFVDCLKSYTDRCFTPQQRKQFNKAVENPIESVHQMCTQRNYQQEYLQHASCIKSTVTEHDHCGDQYSQLVDQVSQGEAISRASLCCSHDRFRRCVMQEAQRICDRGVPDGRAVRFAEQIIDKALSFLQDQCYNYIPNSGDCMTVSYKSDDQLAMSTSPWFNNQNNNYNSPSNPQNAYTPYNTRQRDSGISDHLDPLATDVTVVEMGNTPESKLNNVIPGRSTGNTGSSLPGLQAIDTKVTDVSWMPSEDGRDSTIEGTSKAVLGSRTRPSSYGRSSSWDTSTPNPPQTTPPTRPDWATVSSWHVYSTAGRGSTNNGQGNSMSTHMNPPTNRDPQTTFIERRTTTETWYPAAGSHVGNEVDEPNQMGLSKPKNSAHKVVAVELSLTMVATVLVAYC